MIGLAPLLLVFPVIGVLFNATAGRRFVDADRESGEKWSGWFAAAMSLACFAVTLALMFALRADHHAVVVPLFDWIRVGDFYVPWALHIDTLSVTMLLVITGVGSLIHIYAIGYMHGDPNFSRFFTYLNLFMFFMILLVTGSSYLTLFVGWEGVGLASFLLIGFWFSKEGKAIDDDRGEQHYEGVVNSNAARKAFVANRFGDLFMILAISLTFWTFKTIEFGTEDHHGVFHLAVEMMEHGDTVAIGGTEWSMGAVLSLITLFLLLGAAGKSAQLPFFVWLPDAMAGPTPVSALMHAATMVTSGIYLLVRSNVLIELVRQSPDAIINTPNVIALTGAITALYAGLIAFTQFDIKKVLAYSTVSQLGFMIAAVGMGAYVAGMFHLVTHAFFKALLFMGAGSVIHGMEHGHHHMHDHHDDHHGDDHHDEHHADDHHHHDAFDPQDMRYMGGLIKRMPITGWTYVIGALALAGIFPFAGFWSKDEILAHVDYNDGTIFTVVGLLLTLAAICTAFYMGRQLKMVFFGAPRHEVFEHVPESVNTMTRPLVILAALAILGGAVNIPYFTKAAYDASKVNFIGRTSVAKVLTAEEESGGFQLELEHWLEYSIASFELTDEFEQTSNPIIDMPYTPTWLQMNVAIQSTVLAVLALAGSFFFVYGKKPEKLEDKDPLEGIPPFPLMKALPVNSLYMKAFRPAFNRLADFTAHTLDWDFYHNWVHENLIRANFIRISGFLSNIVDRQIVDGGMVLGLGRFIRGASNALKQIQSGYVRNYAFGLFIGVVALVVYFLVG